MKPLAQLNNAERAKLLFEWFPQEVPDFLVFQKAITENLLRDPAQIKDHWQNQFFTAEFWLKLAAIANKVLDKYKARLAGSSRLFSDQLFDGYVALYSAHCLHEYIKYNKQEDPKLTTAVELLFM